MQLARENTEDASEIREVFVFNAGMIVFWNVVEPQVC